MRLVRLVDRVMDLLEDDSGYRAFTLDGQTVLLEDYLEVRPNQEDRLRRLIEQERLLIGPWYTLPDLFLVSGEAIIRNLQVGHRACTRFGSPMPVGYIPDPFGHIAQMPQLLRGFGLDTYLFMRGLDAETKETLGSVFNWEAPNGDRVLAIYQPDGYFPAAALGHPGPYGRFDGRAPSVDAARTQIEEAVAKMGALQDERTVLLSNGFDHMPEQPELPALLDALNEQMDTVTLEHGTLPQFVNALKEEAHEHGTYRGDLLGNVDHPILSSVYSTRIYLKQQNHRAQRLLTRYAEPMSAWLDAESTGPDARPVLHHAWKTLLRNHPHDDICGCSVDAVHEDNEARFRHVMETGTELLVEHLEQLLLAEGFEAPARTGERTSDVWVFNPHPWTHTYRINTTLLFPTQDGTRGSVPRADTLHACDGDGTPLAVTVLETEDDVMRNPYLEQTWGRRYRVEFDVEVPPMGYQLVHVYEPDAPHTDSDDALASPAPASPASASSAPAVATSAAKHVLENDSYRLTVRDGRVTLHARATQRTVEDLLRFEYQLDAGDTYSFSSVPDHGPWWAEVEDVRLPPTLPGTLRVQHTLQVPARYDSDTGPAGTATLHLATDVRLGTHGAVEMTTRYENTACNGRLRAVMPVHTPVRTTLADGHFRWAERVQEPLQTPESHPNRHGGYPGERSYATHHQGDLVLVEGRGEHTWIANRGLPEYELIDLSGASHVAVTLHRAVGMLSVEGGRIRDCQAGPSIPTPGAQCLRPLHAELAYGTGPANRAVALRQARAFAHPAWAREMPYLPHVQASAAPRPRRGALLQASNPHVEVSALRPTPDEPHTQTVRLCNRSAESQETHLTFGWPVAAWCPTNLHEQWQPNKAQPLSARTLTCTLSAHEVKTILIRQSE